MEEPSSTTPEPTLGAIGTAVKPIIDALQLLPNPGRSQSDPEGDPKSLVDLTRQLPLRISSGCDRTVWRIGSGLVFRALPITEHGSKYVKASLQRDAEVSELLRKYLRRPEVVPKVFTSLAVSGWEGNIEGRVQGVSLEHASPSSRTETDLASFFKDVAAIPDEEAGEAVGGYEQERPNMKKRVGKAIRAWNEMQAAQYFSDPGRSLEGVLMHQLELLNGLDDVEQYEPVLLHCDLCEEHMYIDPETGALRGIIDWSDARMGDPCIDIAGLSFAMSKEMTRNVGSRAGYGRHTVEKGLLYGMCEVIRDLRDQMCGDENVPIEELRKEAREACEYLGLEQVVMRI